MKETNWDCEAGLQSATIVHVPVEDADRIKLLTGDISLALRPKVTILSPLRFSRAIHPQLRNFRSGNETMSTRPPVSWIVVTVGCETSTE